MLPPCVGNPSAHRVRNCLRFLAAHPDSSNREVAAGIGIAHKSQVSKLLGSLADASLLSRRSEGVGKRNSWRLTPYGEEVLQVLPADG